MTTMFFPANSGRFAISVAAHNVAPDEIPARIPSSAPARRANLIASGAVAVSYTHLTLPTNREV